MHKRMMASLLLFSGLFPLRAQQDATTDAGANAVTDAGPRNRIVAVKEAKLGSDVGEVRINGRTVFRFRGTKGGDPYTRAQIVAGRMNADAMANLQPREVGVTRIDGYWVVVARGQMLITADAWTARINQTSPRRLAQQWAALVRRQLAPAPGSAASGGAAQDAG